MWQYIPRLLSELLSSNSSDEIFSGKPESFDVGVVMSRFKFGVVFSLSVVESSVERPSFLR